MLDHIDYYFKNDMTEFEEGGLDNQIKSVIEIIAAKKNISAEEI